MANKFQWQGEPVSVRFGFCKVVKNEEKPLWWYNYEIYINNSPFMGALVPAIEVTTKEGNVFCIANHFGIGVNKLTKGGWPNQCHFSLPDTFEEEWKYGFKIKEFNADEYGEHEEKRRQWQQLNFPEEFKKLEALKKIATKFQ